MKRLAILFLLVAVVFTAGCQTKIIIGSTMTLQWDAPPLGTIPPAQIAYEVVFQPYPTGAIVLVATVTTLEQPITFSLEGKYKIGVRTKRTVDTDVVYSDYAWSDLVGTPTPWVVVYYTLPPMVLRVRVK